MSEQYTPTTNEVREMYVRVDRGVRSREEYEAEFDRWLRGQRVTQMLFWAKVNFTDTCWIWKGNTATNGYGRVRIDGKMVAAHRVAYEWIVGPIPEGRELDHVKEWGCVSRACVNPAHLEPVTHRENTLRGDTITALAARKTHCPRGHELSADNLVPSSLARGRRACLTCSRDRAKERRDAVSARR